MSNNQETIIQIPLLAKATASENRIEFRRHKIVPQMENILQKNISVENEWQQEYYIIYNSYVLEEKDSEN